MESVDYVMSRLQSRSKNRRNLHIDRFKDLNVRWIEQDPTHTKSGWYAKVDSKDMRFSSNAVKSASKLIKQCKVKYWDQFPDKDAFPTTLSHILDSRVNPRLLVRHDGVEINAVLPPQYVIRDAGALLGEFIAPIRENLGEIHGISSLEEGSGDICSYRVVVGQNIMPSLHAKFGQFMMFHLGTSETGARDTTTTFGLYRTICTNSAIGEKLVTKWNHRGDGENFFMKSSERLRSAGYYQGAYGKIFGVLLNTKLVVSARDLLSAMSEENLITNSHYDAATLRVDAPTEDGRPIETQYDMFNLLTRSAQDLPSIQSRQVAESRSLHMFTEPGGVFEALRKSGVERFKQKRLTHDLEAN